MDIDSDSGSLSLFERIVNKRRLNAECDECDEMPEIKKQKPLEDSSTFDTEDFFNELGESFSIENESMQFEANNVFEQQMETTPQLSQVTEQHANDELQLSNAEMGYYIVNTPTGITKVPALNDPYQVQMEEYQYLEQQYQKKNDQIQQLEEIKEMIKIQSNLEELIHRRQERYQQNFQQLLKHNSDNELGQNLSQQQDNTSSIIKNPPAPPNSFDSSTMDSAVYELVD